MLNAIILLSQERMTTPLMFLEKKLLFHVEGLGTLIRLSRISACPGQMVEVNGKLGCKSTFWSVDKKDAHTQTHIVENT